MKVPLGLAVTHELNIVFVPTVGRGGVFSDSIFPACLITSRFIHNGC